MKKRRSHDAGFKARVELEAVKGERTVSELAAEYGVHPTMIHQWKKALLDGAADVFERGGKKAPEVDEDTVPALHAKIGELAVANDFCHRSSRSGSASDARHDREEPPAPVGRCAMPPAVNLAVIVPLRATGRNGDEPRPHAADRQTVLETPFYGVRQMTWHLQNEGHAVNEKRIRRLMRLMRLMPIYQKPDTSKPAKGHKTYPYLLGGLRVERPSQVWCAPTSPICRCAKASSI